MVETILMISFTDGQEEHHILLSNFYTILTNENVNDGEISSEIWLNTFLNGRLLRYLQEFDPFIPVYNYILKEVSPKDIISYEIWIEEGTLESSELCKRALELGISTNQKFTSKLMKYFFISCLVEHKELCSLSKTECTMEGIPFEDEIDFVYTYPLHPFFNVLPKPLLLTELTDSFIKSYNGKHVGKKPLNIELIYQLSFEKAVNLLYKDIVSIRRENSIGEYVSIISHNGKEYRIKHYVRIVVSFFGDNHVRGAYYSEEITSTKFEEDCFHIYWLPYRRLGSVFSTSVSPLAKNVVAMYHFDNFIVGEMQTLNRKRLVFSGLKCQLQLERRKGTLVVEGCELNKENVKKWTSEHISKIFKCNIELSGEGLDRIIESFIERNEERSGRIEKIEIGKQTFKELYSTDDKHQVVEWLYNNMIQLKF